MIADKDRHTGLQLIHEYHAASPGSRAFNTRLIEMVAVAVHAIGVYLFNLNLDIGHHKDLVEWQPEEDDVFWYYHPKGPLPTLFIHRWYQDHDQYPHGVADVVGYWAEARIMGGVVLFDRRAAGQREAHEDVCINPTQANDLGLILTIHISTARSHLSPHRPIKENLPDLAAARHPEETTPRFPPV